MMFEKLVAYGSLTVFLLLYWCVSYGEYLDYVRYGIM